MIKSSSNEPSLERRVVKRRSKSTMREIVSDAKSSSSKQKQRRRPPGINDGSLIDTNGFIYTLSKKNISPEDAVRSVKSGAQVVFDECACGGICGFIYATAEELSMLAKSKPVLNSHKGLTGSLSLWQTDDGKTILLAQGPVQWK